MISAVEYRRNRAGYQKDLERGLTSQDQAFTRNVDLAAEALRATRLDLSGLTGILDQLELEQKELLEKIEQSRREIVRVKGDLEGQEEFLKLKEAIVLEERSIPRFQQAALNFERIRMGKK